MTGVSGAAAGQTPGSRKRWFADLQPRSHKKAIPFVPVKPAKVHCQAGLFLVWKDRDTRSEDERE